MRPLALALVPVLLLLSAAAPAQSSRPAYDLVIRGGLVLDGTGAPARHTDLAIAGDRIAALGDLSATTARRTLDAKGLVVAPGFIDLHTHIDADLTKHPRAGNFVAMGVTTAISGNCGGSELDVAAHLEAVAVKGSALNYGTLLGAGTVRNAVMKYARKKPTPDELAKMCDLVRAGMKAGAFGLSTGLIYVPGSYARAEELTELCKAVHELGGLYVSHMRSEEQEVLAAIDEALAIGKGSGCPVHISHLKASGKPQWGWSERILAHLRDARSSGQAVTADQYAYTASSTSLDILFPDAELQVGKKEFAKKLADDAAYREEMREALAATMRRAGFGDLSYAQIATAPAHPELAGKTLKDAAKAFFGKDDAQAQADAAIKVCADAEGKRVSMVYHKMCEDDVARFLAEPWIAVASDSGIRSEGSGKPHPRGSGNNVRVLGRYVREKKVLPLEVAVQKMTSVPARAFGIEGRGELKPGAFADVVVLDPATVADRATYDDPLAQPVGITFVVVNGKVVVEQGRQNEELPGRVLRPTRR
jgi:N-acyl-D-amino-acid deacylase